MKIKAKISPPEKKIKVEIIKGPRSHKVDGVTVHNLNRAQRESTNKRKQSTGGPEPFNYNIYDEGMK